MGEPLKPPPVRYCPFCGSDKVKVIKWVPRCYGCKTVFSAYRSRSFRPRTGGGNA